MPPKGREVIERTPIDSENLISVGYEESTQTMEVEFHNGGALYRFYNVSPSIFHDMLRAHTPGQYFYHFIRLSYPYVRLQ